MVQFGSGSEGIQPKRPLGVLAGWRGKAQPWDGGSIPLHHPAPDPHPLLPCRAAAGAGSAVTLPARTSTALMISGLCLSGAARAVWPLQGSPSPGQLSDTLAQGKRKPCGHRDATAIRIPWPSPSALGAPGQQPRARQWVYSQVPLIAGGDRTAAWPPWPAAPAKRQQLGISARATCSPMCSLGCWGHPGVPLAAGRAPRVQVSCGKSQGVLCTSRRAPGHP